MFKICNNHAMKKEMPPDLVEHLVLAEGPPLWHIDSQKDDPELSSLLVSLQGCTSKGHLAGLTQLLVSPEAIQACD